MSELWKMQKWIELVRAKGIRMDAFGIVGIALVVLVCAVCLVRHRRLKVLRRFKKQEIVFDIVTDVLAKQGVHEYSLRVSADGDDIALTVDRVSSTDDTRNQIRQRLVRGGINASVEVSEWD